MDQRNDRLVVLTVVIALALVVLGVVGSEVYLIAVGRQLPDSIVVMGSGALGAIAGMLATTATRPQVPAAPPPPPPPVDTPVDAP